MTKTEAKKSRVTVPLKDQKFVGWDVEAPFSDLKILGPNVLGQT
jgi:hypothetical protein